MELLFICVGAALVGAVIAYINARWEKSEDERSYERRSNCPPHDFELLGEPLTDGYAPRFKCRKCGKEEGL